MLEYQTDLKQYWKRSHGHVINSLSSCPLFHHIFRTLDRAGRPRRWVTLSVMLLCSFNLHSYFEGTQEVICLLLSVRSTEELPEPASILLGHAETLLPLLSLLGLFKDKTPPTASNYHTQHGEKLCLHLDLCI